MHRRIQQAGQGAERDVPGQERHDIAAPVLAVGEAGVRLEDWPYGDGEDRAADNEVDKTSGGAPGEQLSSLKSSVR